MTPTKGSLISLLKKQQKFQIEEDRTQNERREGPNYPSQYQSYHPDTLEADFGERGPSVVQAGSKE